MSDGIGASTDPPRADAPGAHERVNLIAQITDAAVASDYPPRPGGTRGGAQARRQRLLVAAVALGLAGFVLALGVSSQVLNAPAVDSLRAQLIERVEAADSRNRELVDVSGALRDDLRAAQQEGLGVSGAGRTVADEVAELELVTGYTAAVGPGALVTLDDAPPDETSEDPELERVLDKDLQLAVNGLWAAGAEAIAVNGQRLTAQSAIRSAGGAILVNYRPLKPPYRVEAIGPQNLAGRFEQTPDAAQLRDVSAQFGIGLTASPVDELRLRPATTPLPEDAQVVESNEGNAP